ncbi:MAG: Rsd/AlgQ family anti-sigma factor [Granulosicoccaceae bacterium]|jgi:regulator of sigma D
MMEGTQSGYTGENRRAGTQDLSRQLTDERDHMLVAFCRLAGVEPFDDPDNFEQWRDRLDEFCQILVDYLAIGHFGLYQRIVNGEERRDNVRELARKLYPDIANTTETALDFNDKYETATLQPASADFSQDLSSLGEILATRIELEDDLLDALNGSTTPTSTQ